MSIYILPAILLAVFIIAIIRKKNPYECFLKGAKDAVKLAVNILPYLTAVFIMTELFDKSGLNSAITDLSAGFFGIFGIDKALIPLILVKPFSGSGSLGVLTEILSEYGADSYLGRCASVIFASSETIFYVGAVYYSECRKKAALAPLMILIASNFFTIVFAVFIVKIM